MTEENKVILVTDKLPNFADTFIDINTYKRLEQENKELKETIEAFKTMATVPTRMYNECERERCKYGKALLEIREELCYSRTFYEGYFDSENLSRTDKVIKKINEVLQ
jgi:hypothetical protein